ncbi:hypothetical protein F5I97DRAFT_1827060 [Phlebopus sp. FC_14]|nr:hypothetical protein F5I97DRAFT_1827060 [Phlebopus sp. FC_14]
MSLTAEAVKAHEEECIFPSFDSDVAWELGDIMRANARRKFTRPVVIYIAHANSSQLLFFATSRPGTLPDNMHWVKRKEQTVLRWGKSSLGMRLGLQVAGKSMQQALKDKFEMSDPSIYGCHGGGFPIKVKGVEGLVGVIVVSGLAQEDDHMLIVDAIKEYLAVQA